MNAEEEIDDDLDSHLRLRMFVRRLSVIKRVLQGVNIGMSFTCKENQPIYTYILN
jgi:hypothetical protein